MKKITTIVIAFLAIASLATVAITLSQISQTKAKLENDLQYRSSVLAGSLRESVEPNFISQSDTYLQSLVEKYTHGKRIAGLAVVDNTEKIIARSSSLPKQMLELRQTAANVMDADTADGDFTDFDGKNLYVFAIPLHDRKTVVGALIIVQNASYINEQLIDIWRSNAIRFFVQILLFFVAIFLIMRWVIYYPIQSLVRSLKLIRLDKEDNSSFIASHHPFLRPLLKEVSQIQKSLIQARRAASEEARASLERLDSPWTAERLKQFTRDMLKDRAIVTVSNREPYIHTKVGGEIEYYFPASGMVTAIEPVMQATGGTWIAHGSGDADREVVDKKDIVQVPPEDPKYALKRVWLSEEEENGYYYGFSNQALYPLCLMAHTRPVFSKEHWELYEAVNEKFAQTVLSEIKNLHKPVVFIQDFHFTLLPRIIKNARPDATVGLFWHIPWVSPEAFSICPWKEEILDGMLGADLIGFHTQLHCNNFVDTVGRELESLIDFEQFAVTRKGHVSFIEPFPASIAFSNSDRQGVTKEEKKQYKDMLKNLGIKAKYIGVGVDRMDYTKGVLERLKAIEIFLNDYPVYRGQFTFIQISPVSRSKIQKSREFSQQVEYEVERINSLFKEKTWKPIVLIERRHDHDELNQYYKLANFCLITSLHDGMNLVAKEFVAARNDEKGVLILSQFTGASKELKHALIVNPYNGEETAEAIYTALTMPVSEQAKRMKKLRTSVKNYNIYRWSAEFLKTIVGLE